MKIKSLIIFFFVIIISCKENVKSLKINCYRKVDNMEIIQDTISIISWNLGYAALGKDSDFIVDGGKKILPPKQHEINKNANGIIEFLIMNMADIFLFQEIAEYSLFKREINLLDILSDCLKKYTVVFSENINFNFFKLKFRVGNSIFSLFTPSKTIRYDLPLDKKSIYRKKQKFHFIISSFEIKDSDKQLIVINIHLSAFDKDAIVRMRQLQKLKEVMLTEYKKGNYVVVGGDWNLRITKTNFLYTTQKKYLKWIYDIPLEFKPEDWSWGIDYSNPTFRTAERPYLNNENYTSIIDGFLISPNLEIMNVKTNNLNFQNSDHNPVYIKLKLTK